ncbi:MAG: hypothetical protein BGO76_03080 [Caedibacter sp. 38-128]|nr:hypothetical protein [Holosporales bacterium]OJX08256.1 MAG: hypothetical protein BGO76_03080 [Caedibacter sp. 38-128]
MVTLKQAILDPKSSFGTPQEVMGASNFSLDEKIIILKLWAYDAEQLEIAEEENMTGTDDDMLKHIIDCLSTLEKQKAMS